MTETATETVTGGTSVLTDWRAGLPDDLRADKSLESFKDVAGLAKSYVETKKLVGARTEGLVKVPDDKATPEDLAAWRKAQGVPDTPEGYQIQRPDVALDGAWDTNAEAAFLAAMHKEGASPKIVQAALTVYGEFVRRQLQTAQREAQAAAAELRREWGLEYDAHVGRANRALQEFGGDALVDLLAQSGFGRHPLMVKAWAAVGHALVEHGAMTGEGLATGLTPEEADAQIRAKREEMGKLPEGSKRLIELADEIIALTKVKTRGRAA